MNGLIDAVSFSRCDGRLLRALMDSLSRQAWLKVALYCESAYADDEPTRELIKAYGAETVDERSAMDAYRFFLSAGELPSAIKKQSHMLTIAVLNDLFRFDSLSSDDVPLNEFRWWREYDRMLCWYPYPLSERLRTTMQLSAERCVIAAPSAALQDESAAAELAFIEAHGGEFDWAFLKEADARMSGSPLVTVVTITYNLVKNGRESAIRECIESVKRQSYKNIEHLIIDGVSEDGTLELLKPYVDAGDIRIFTEKDAGVYDAMNKGLARAAGEYIVYLNSDDCYCTEDAVRTAIGAALRCDADYVFGSARCIKADGDQLLWQGNIDMLPYAANYCHQTLFVKTAVMRDMNGFDLSYRVSSDSDLMIRLYSQNRSYVKIDEVYVNYRMDGMSGVNAAQSQRDHARAFYTHIGASLGMTYGECLGIWQLRRQDQIDLGYQLQIMVKLGRRFDTGVYLSPLLISGLSGNKQLSSRTLVKAVIKRALKGSSKVYKNRWKVYLLWGKLPCFIKKIG